MGTTTTNITFKGDWAKRLVREKLRDEINTLEEKGIQLWPADPDQPFVGLPGPGRPRWTHDKLPQDPNHAYYGDGKSTVGAFSTQPGKVCIVGAGIAGLYIAMILDKLGITYDILEANSRVGGRVYTHKFSENPHDYCDIGAMRFPKIPIMNRTFDLFARTDMPLMPYYLKGQNTRDLFNDHFSDERSCDPFHVSIESGGDVPNDVVDNVSNIIDEAFRPYKEELAKCFSQGFDKLMAADDFSTREFFRRGGPDGQQKHYDFPSILWMETMTTSTNLFDQAFSESVMDSLDFDYPGSPEWYCIKGGSSLLSNAMNAKLNQKAETGKRVESISIDRTPGKGDANMSVKCANEPNPRSGYCTVFATPALGCLARMDLRSLELHPSQKDAIRSLHYDDSVKVALKFTYPWWIVDCGITQGGIASTDLPLRTCVYPSYNIGDDKDKPAVLLASYTWAQDADRMGSLVNSNDETELVELILRDLARLHEGRGVTYDGIKNSFTGVYKAYSWSQDPAAAGAFALFGPGQFKNLYPYLTRPAADSKFHIVGEAASAHHAWIVGALNSAYTAVYRFLYRFKLWDAIRALEKDWGKVEELESGQNGTVHLQVMLGKLPKRDQFRV
ncbi:FAD/NAD(P)-binding domain-containing protein [Xylaria grammica]|nr:FAD/NAD(P)-binding domain-containing protein [Xylaria grammica]